MKLNRLCTSLMSASVSCAIVAGLLVGCDNKTDTGSNNTASTQASGEQPKKKGVIGVSLLTLSNPFFKEMADAITDEAQKNGYEVRVVSADQDAPRQRDQVNDFIAGHAAAVILTPVDSSAIGTAIKQANDAGIPVFTADVATTAPSVQVVSHIATDNFGGGVMAAQAIAEALNGTGNVAIIDHPEVESVIQRTKGFESEIVKHPNIHVVAKLPSGGQRERAFKVMQDILQSHPDVNAVFAINDPSALGAVAALEAAGKLNQVKVVGFDGQPEAKKAVKDGRIFADAVQDAAQIGRLTVQAMVHYAAGDPVEKSHLIPTKLYKKADADADPSVQ